MIDLAQLLDLRLAIVGTSGSGKTYAARGLVERLIRAAARVCVVDPTGVWFGLRSGVDRNPKGGLKVLIFGGLHADVPIDQVHGDALGRTLAASDARSVIDLSEFPSDAARRRFMLAFLEALYEGNREPLHLVLDEADLWAPQKPRPESAQLQGRVSQVVRRGRARGFVPWLITQRPAVLDKDVLSQADALIAMKLTSSQDRAAIGAWIEGQADRADAKGLLAALPKLANGAGFVWAPGLETLEQVAFPANATYDSGRTPRRGDRDVGPVPLASVTADAFRALLTQAPDSATPETPAATAAAIATARKQAFDEGYAQGKRAFQTAFRAAAEQAAAAVNAAAAALAALRVPEAASALEPGADPPPASSPRPAADTVNLAPGPRRVLQVLAARHPAPQSEAQWATLARMARRGGAWAGYRRTLQTEGLVHRHAGRWSATASGLAAIDVAPAEPQSPAELLRAWKQAIGSGPAKLLDALLAHPEGLDRQQLAALVRMSAAGGSFSTYLRTLINNELANPGRGKRVVASPVLRAQETGE